MFYYTWKLNNILFSKLNRFLIIAVDTTANANETAETYKSIQGAITNLAEKIKGVVDKQNENNDKKKNHQSLKGQYKNNT